MEVYNMSQNLKNILKTVSAQVVDLQDSTDSIETRLTTKAPITNPQFQGTVSGVSKAMVGLDKVDNTSDIDKPVSTKTQAAIDSACATIVGGAPEVLNTLKELADALGDDANYAANLLTLLEKTTTGGTTKTNIYTNDLLQIKQRGATGNLLTI